MLSGTAKLLLVLTSFAPVLLTLAFMSWLQGQFKWGGVSNLSAAGLLIAIAVLTIHQAARRLETFEIQIQSLRTVDREIIGFLVAYLLPLISQPSAPLIDWRVAIFVLALFFMVVWGTHSYHFNPLLGMLGFHFYEVTTTGNITYVLITRKDLRRTRSVGRVVQVSEYMLLDATGGNR